MEECDRWTPTTGSRNDFRHTAPTCGGGATGAPAPPADAVDAVQEAWLRLSRSDSGQVENLGGWLTTVVARVSLNMLQSRKTRREELVGARLPEEVGPGADAAGPEHEAVL